MSWFLVPSRDGAMTPGERALVYGIAAAIYFAWFASTHPTGAPETVPGALFPAVFAAIGLATGTSLSGRLLLGAIPCALAVLANIGTGRILPGETHRIILQFSLPLLFLALAPYGDPAPWMRRQFSSAASTASKIVLGAIYYGWAAVLAAALFAGAGALLMAMFSIYGLVISWRAEPVDLAEAARMAYLRAQYAGLTFEEAKQQTIASVSVAGEIFSFIFGVSLVRALMRAFSR